MSKKITVNWEDGLSLNAYTPNHEAPIPLDADAEVGGQGKGHRPLQMLLVGLAGCMAMDAVSILKKKRQEFDHFQVWFDLDEIEQNAEHPHYYTKIVIHFEAGGPNISAEALARAIELSYERYCPANAMLRAVADISYDYQIVQPQSSS
ncbi:MAG: OsmC family protein [Anaerolineales bacterium]